MGVFLVAREIDRRSVWGNCYGASAETGTLRRWRTLNLTPAPWKAIAPLHAGLFP